MGCFGALAESLDRMGYLIDDIEDSNKFWGKRKRTGEGVFVKLYDSGECCTALECFSREWEVYGRIFRSRPRKGDSGAGFGEPRREADGELFARPYHFFMLGEKAGAFVSRFYRGQSLSQRMLGYRKDLSDIDARIADMISVLKPFGRLHEEGFVYVDVKPDDLLVNTFPRDMFTSMRLIDFDYSRRLGESVGNQIFATEGYISKDFDPALHVTEYAPATDISALGFIFLDMICAYDQSMHTTFTSRGWGKALDKGTGMTVLDREAERRSPCPSSCTGERPGEKDRGDIRHLDSWMDCFCALVPDRSQHAKAERLHGVVKKMLERERWTRYNQVGEIIGDLMPLVA